MRIKTLGVAASAALALVAGLFLSASIPQLEDWSASTTDAAGLSIYWGATIDGSPYGVGNPPWDMRAVDIFESHAGKKVSIIHWGQPWKMADGNGNLVFQSFQFSTNDKIRAHGSIPLVDWSSWVPSQGTTQPEFQNSDIYQGKYDSYIRQWATDAKTWGHPLFLRFNWEMNGWWFPWGEGLTASGAPPNGNQAGGFVTAWRHVHDVFTQVGATNVSWVWCPDRVKGAPLSQIYPGDAYVDWTCADGYNWGSDRGYKWQTFTKVFQQVYSDIVAVAPKKPIMLGELASSEDGGPLGRPDSKVAWIKDALSTQLPKYFPNIKAIMWFNSKDGNPDLDWPIESSPESQSAFSAAIKTVYFAANNFGQMDMSPIPANPCFSQIVSPGRGAVSTKSSTLLQWTAANCANHYVVILKQDSRSSPTQVWQNTVYSTQFQTPTLLPGHTYYWRVRACNTFGCVGTRMSSFAISSSATS